MKKIGAEELTKSCLTLLDRLPPEGVIVIKRGQPVARLLPYRPHGAERIGCLKDKIAIRGDLKSTGTVWSGTESRLG